ncbi:hypothetical protein CEP10_08255 [Cylindrospermopsis raciborskii S07]|nr:hypothetical protein CEP12_12095 [Cylindrospermopsis raciborskii S14]PNK07564.1 hypothetical protein CEP11_03740 [Cylindrospermopsis raciborskii S10]PNK08076.1 hypothetical protein CEP10_08255 [Cylindrospermopsis raciborskii S07]PNK17381.1 hypothetical protein CEP09_03080 [Cylindrospermopsis raciborskii S06]
MLTICPHLFVVLIKLMSDLIGPLGFSDFYLLVLPKLVRVLTSPWELIFDKWMSIYNYSS